MGMTAIGAPHICALGYDPLLMAPLMRSLGFQPVCATFGRLGTASLYGSSYWWVACRCMMHIRHGRNQDVAHNMACFNLRKHNGHSHATPWACPVSRLDGSLDSTPTEWPILVYFTVTIRAVHPLRHHTPITRGMWVAIRGIDRTENCIGQSQC